MRLCAWYLCVCRGSKYFKVIFDRFTLVADLCGTMPVSGHLWTQFDVVLAVEFLVVILFALLSRIVLVSKCLVI